MEDNFRNKFVSPDSPEFNDFFEREYNGNWGALLLQLQICRSHAEMRAVAADICKTYLHGAWRTVDAEQLDFRRISGGLSNFLYYVALPNPMNPEHKSPKDRLKKHPQRSTSFSFDEPLKVLVRIYGQRHGERSTDDIVTESVIFTLLSERKLGPKLHGVFSGGRIEEYIPGRPLATDELSVPYFSLKIAEKMAAIHGMDVPLSKEPNWIWKTMNNWVITTKERLSVDIEGKPETEKEMLKFLKSLNYENEIKWVNKYVSNAKSPVVFCHNDMQEGNILLLEDDANAADDTLQTDINEVSNTSENNSEFDESQNNTNVVTTSPTDDEEPKLVLIDFEYCAYNYRGFDLANHFQEWMYNYTNPEFPFYYECTESYPTREQKDLFIRQYLKHAQGTFSIEDVNQLHDEVNAFAIVSHLFWGLWSIVNASKSQIPFGYWEYACSRLKIYVTLKTEVMKSMRGKLAKRKIIKDKRTC